MSNGATIREVEIAAIEVLNPRERNQKVFQELVESIRLLGIKKPITVAERSGPDGPRYVLVCGQGRMEAFQALGQVAIYGEARSPRRRGVGREPGRPCRARRRPRRAFP